MTWLLCLLLALTACGDTESARRPGARRVPVDVSAAQLEDLDLVVQAVGTLRAERAIQVKPKRAGHLVALPLVEGAAVEAGTVLARLDDDEARAAADVAQATLRDAEVRIRNATREFDRIAALHRDGLVSRQEFDDARVEYERAQAGLALAQANLELAQAQLAETVVTAPFAGLVGQRRVDLGAYVQDGDTIATLLDVDPLEIEFGVPERYVGRLALGGAVAVSVTSHPEVDLRGEIVFVAPEVDPVNRTATVKARLPNPETMLRPGQFASVRITLARRPGTVVVPEEAVVPDDERDVVFVVRDGQAAVRPVETGLRVPGRVEIRTGLTPGEVVVRAGQAQLDRTRPTPVEALGAP